MTLYKTLPTDEEIVECARCIVRKCGATSITEEQMLYAQIRQKQHPQYIVYFYNKNFIHTRSIDFKYKQNHEIKCNSIW